MCTARALTVSPSMLCAGGVYLVPGGTWSRGVPGQGGVPGPGGCTWSRGGYLVWGVYLVPGVCAWSRGVYLVPGGYLAGPGGSGGVPGQVLPPVDRITDACKNITLPQLRCGR